MRLINFVPEVFSLFVEVVMAAVVVSRRASNERKIKPSRKMSMGYDTHNIRSGVSYLCISKAEGKTWSCVWLLCSWVGKMIVYGFLIWILMIYKSWHCRVCKNKFMEKILDHDGCTVCWQDCLALIICWWFNFSYFLKPILILAFRIVKCSYNSGFRIIWGLRTSLVRTS